MLWCNPTVCQKIATFKIENTFSALADEGWIGLPIFAAADKCDILSECSTHFDICSFCNVPWKLRFQIVQNALVIKKGNLW